MITRRATVSALLAMGLAPWLARFARAQGYPEKLIKMIVPAPPGGQTDVLARVLALQMEARLGKNVIIDNRPGAGGALGARTAAAAEADGYTIFFGNTSTLAVIPAVSKRAGYDPAKDFAPVAGLSESYMILVVHPSFPAQTIGEFIAYAKTNPGKLNFGHAGAGNVTHLTGEMFRSMAGVDFVNVPHKGGAESITALLGQQVHFLFESPVVLLPLIAAGKLRALGVTAGKRQPGAENIPTMVESGMPNFVATLLTGVVAPGGTPPAIVNRLNAVINEALATEKVKAMLTKFGSTPNEGSAAEFAKFLTEEKAKWTSVAQKAGVSID
jgi:tripartite-type tricarboxylate transporter receptor subunit TctC